jgi:hypothetical protein
MASIIFFKLYINLSLRWNMWRFWRENTRWSLTIHIGIIVVDVLMSCNFKREDVVSEVGMLTETGRRHGRVRHFVAVWSLNRQRSESHGPPGGWRCSLPLASGPPGPVCSLTCHGAIYFIIQLLRFKSSQDHQEFPHNKVKGGGWIPKTNSSSQSKWIS